jgi:hypothetical protein
VVVLETMSLWRFAMQGSQSWSAQSRVRRVGLERARDASAEVEELPRRAWE